MADDTLRIEINYVFTDAAIGAMAGKAPLNSWAVPQGVPLPATGDLITFGREERNPTFMVKNRLFIWKTPRHLLVQSLLDLAS